MQTTKICLLRCVYAGFFSLILLLYADSYISNHSPEKYFCHSWQESRHQFNAFIITASCLGIRYNSTLKNLNRAFPNVFRFYCFKNIPLNDTRIHAGPTVHLKKISSLLISMIEIWSFEIQKFATNELDWSFIFEDGIDIVDRLSSSLKLGSPNYPLLLQEVMRDREVQLNDGFFYLGTCNSSFNVTSRPLTSNLKANHLFHHYRGHGLCSYATAITKRRARFFWTEISLYRSSEFEPTIDFYLQQYNIRSHSYFYTVGANIKWSSRIEQYGILFRDPEIFGSLVDDIEVSN